MLQQTHLLTAAATDSYDTTNPTNVMNLPEKNNNTNRTDICKKQDIKSQK